MKVMKNYRKYITILLVAVTTLVATAQNSLESYLEIGAQNNPGLKASFNEYMASLESIEQVGALPDPTLAFGFFVKPVETRVGPQQAKISLQQMFPWFGTLNAREDVAAEQAKAKYEAFEETRSKLYYDIKVGWYNLYYTNKAIDVTNENINILKSIKELVLVGIESGKASAVDALSVEMEKLKLENQLQDLTDKLETQKIGFNNLLNVEATSEIEIPAFIGTDRLTLGKDALLDSVRTLNHQLLGIGYQESAMAKQRVVARNMGRPNFTVGLDYTFIGESSNTMLAPGESGRDALMLPTVGLSLPLNRKKYGAMEKEVVLMEESVQFQKEEKLNTLETLFDKGYTDYLAAQRRIDLNQKQLELAKTSLRILETEYSADSKNFDELLRIEREVLAYSLDLERSVSDLASSIAYINYLMGK
jgi:outer membrane protein TolC